MQQEKDGTRLVKDLVESVSMKVQWIPPRREVSEQNGKSMGRGHQRVLAVIQPMRLSFCGNGLSHKGSNDPVGSGCAEGQCCLNSSRAMSVYCVNSMFCREVASLSESLSVAHAWVQKGGALPLTTGTCDMLKYCVRGVRYESKR